MRGWDMSAAAWIASQGECGDFTREFVLDPVMVGRVAGRGFRTALDVGCGEGRFCRVLRQLDVEPVGIDPTEALITRAQERDPDGTYLRAVAEALPFRPQSFDLVVSYLTLIDITDFEAAIAEMGRVLKPGGTLLIANLNSFVTANPNGSGWVRDAEGRCLHYAVERYLDTYASWLSWKGIEIENWHRPLSAYMHALLAEGLQLVAYDEPAPVGGPEDWTERYRRVPYAHVMEWRKPE